MARRLSKKPLWPIVVVVAVVSVGLYLGKVMTDSGGRAEALPGQDDEGQTMLEGRVPTLEDRIRVEVLNGSGVPGVAGHATELLRDQGFDVVYFGNESSFGRDSSVVLDRTQKDGALEMVRQSLGIAAARTDLDASLLVDVTVLLGGDWESVGNGQEGFTSAVQDGEADGADRSWWDFRRFLEGGR